MQVRKKREKLQCCSRTPCCSKVGLNRGPWSPDEDLLLSKYILKFGEGRWRTLPKKAGLKRCGKSCRLRWMNYLRPDVKRGYISPEEEDLILRLHRLLGNRWSLIAGRIPGRTDNEIKNYWNTHLKKKLLSQGIDPRTHKPLPQQSLLGENLPFTKPMPKSSEETESEQNNGVGQVQNQICRSEESELQKGQTQDLQDSSNQKQKTESQRTFHDDLSTVQTTHNNYSNILLSSLNCHQSPTIIPETAHHPKPLFKATTAAREYFNFNPTSNHHSTNIPFLLHDILPSSIPASDRGRFSSTLSPLGLTVNFCNSNNNDPVKQGYPFISMDQIQNPSHAAAAVAPDLMQQPFPGNENTVLPTVPRNMELQSGLFEGSGSRPWATATDQSCLQKWQRLQKAQGLTHEMTNLNTSMNTNMNLSSNGNVELNNSNNHGYGHQNGGLFVDVNNHSAHFPAISHQSTHLSHFGMDQESLNVSDPWLLSHCHPHL